MRKEIKKVTTRMLKEMNPGDTMLFSNQTYAMLLSARSLCCQANKRYDMDVRISYVEKFDKSYDITVKREA